MYDKQKPIDIYNNEIAPKIKKIDNFLKTKKDVCIKDACEMLNIGKIELENILKKLDCDSINSKTILPIMLQGSSFICDIMRKEIERGSPYFYTPDDLSYIYGINCEKIKKAYKFLNLQMVTSNQIPAILIQIDLCT